MRLVLLMVALATHTLLSAPPKNEQHVEVIDAEGVLLLAHCTLYPSPHDPKAIVIHMRTDQTGINQFRYIEESPLYHFLNYLLVHWDTVDPIPLRRGDFTGNMRVQFSRDRQHYSKRNIEAGDIEVFLEFRHRDNVFWLALEELHPFPVPNPPPHQNIVWRCLRAIANAVMGPKDSVGR